MFVSIKYTSTVPDNQSNTFSVLLDVHNQH